MNNISVPSPFSLKANDRAMVVEADPKASLLYKLRNDFGLSGPKYACGIGECGASCVLIEGRAKTTGRHAPEVTSMPVFRDVLDRGQMENPAAYLRARFAPDKPAWSNLGPATDRITAMVH